MDVTKPHKFTGFGAMDVTKPYKFMGLRHGLPKQKTSGQTLGWLQVGF